MLSIASTVVWSWVFRMTEQPKKYYEYYYTWRMAEAMRKAHKRNGRKVCTKVGLNAVKDSNKKWVIWYNRMEDTKREHTSNARYYDK